MNYSALVLIACVACGAQAQTREHAETSIVLRLPALPVADFPLFGSARESEWSPHWNPRILFPPDQRQLAGTVFTTSQGADEAVWLMDTYDERALRIGYVIIRPGMYATRLDIALKAAADQTTVATVTYRQTALSDAGDRYVKEFARDFPSERDHWEHAISRRLLELARRP